MLRVARAVLALALGAVLLPIVVASPAQAVSPCRAYATLPARVSIDRADKIIYSTLRSHSGCLGWNFDGGYANLDGPQGMASMFSWDQFGSTDRYDLWDFEATGKYVVEDPDLLLYDNNYNTIPVSWERHYTDVRYGGKFYGFTVHHSNGRVSMTARTLRYWPASGAFTPYRYKWVAVQRRRAGTSTWYTVAHIRSNSSGIASWSYSTTAKYMYRLSFAASATIWGAFSLPKYA